MSHSPQGDQAPKPHRKLKISLAIIGVLVVLALGCLGNFLFDFALNPHASYTMKQMQDSAAEDEPQQTYAEEDAALSWFQKKGAPCSMTADDGTPLAGYYFAQKGQSGVAPQMDVQNTSGQDAAGERGSQHEYAICLHGYTNDPQSMALYIKRFYDRGMTVLAPAARAHAGSGGDYIGMGWPERLDVVKWIEAIVSRDPEARILVFGESMGAATAMNVAGEELPSQVKCIIEDCGYTSVWDEFSVQLADVFGLPSFPLLDVANVVCNLRAGYDFHAASSLEQLKKAEVPMLFIHGDADTFVPYNMLDQNFDACASKVKQKLVVEGAAHARSAQVDPELYWNTVDEFLDKNF